MDYSAIIRGYLWTPEFNQYFFKIIKDFIQQKKISILSIGIQTLWKTFQKYNVQIPKESFQLNQIFDKQLLNKEGTDFNEEILQTYQ